MRRNFSDRPRIAVRPRRRIGSVPISSYAGRTARCRNSYFVAGCGPFVMNTFEEIGQAMRDFENGLMGSFNEAKR